MAPNPSRFDFVPINRTLRKWTITCGLQYISYDEPQVIVQFYDGYTGKLAYAEGISTADAKDDQTISPKISRWPVSKK